MNASEIFLIVWACLATAYAVYLYNALKMYMVKSATLAATLAMIAIDDVVDVVVDDVIDDVVDVVVDDVVVS